MPAAPATQVHTTTPAGAQATTLIPTTITLVITTPMTVFYGERVDGQITIQSADMNATGTVVVYDGTQPFCTIPATGGACLGTASSVFPVGTHVFTATYSGDATHTPARSNAVTVVVKQDTTMTSLASSVNPVVAGRSVTYAAVVQGEHGPVAGDVEFFDGSTLLGRVTLNAQQQASLTALMATVGTHAITAVYVGSTNSAGSTSAAVQEVVLAPIVASTTTLSANPTTIVSGGSLTLTSHVAPASGTATGTVTFVDGGTTLGTATLDATGNARLVASLVTVGQHSIVAQYGGDATTSPSNSTPVMVTVTAAPPSGGFTLGLTQITVNAGETAVIPVTTDVTTANMTANCSGLPDESSCSYFPGTLRIQTAGPRDCGTSKPYGTAEISLAGPMLAGLLALFVPRRRKVLKGLLVVICMLSAMASLSGCGNCTDLGSRPGTYNVTVGLSGASGTQKLVLIVKP